MSPMILPSICLLLTSLLLAVNGQHYNLVYNANSPPAGPSGVVYDAHASDPRHLAHPAVVANAARDAQLPPELVNDFYKNPQIAAGLAHDSWFGDKEFPVFNRQADKIPRSEIAKIINRIKHLERRRRAARAIYQ